MPFHDEVGEVLDPTQQASEPTEAALRTFPLTSPFTTASDAADFYTGTATSPDASGVPTAISIGRQFDDVEGGGIADSDTLKESDITLIQDLGKQFDAEPGGGIVDNTVDEATSIGDNVADAIPWVPLGLFAVLLIAVNAFAGGAGEGLTS